MDIDADLSTIYDTTFFSRQKDESLSGATGMLPIVLDLLPKVNSIVDVGCGLGTWASVAQQLRPGIKVLGVDGASRHRVPMRLRPHDFLSANITEPFLVEAKFDLAICLEVAEHISATDLDGLLENLTRLTPLILFSAAMPGQGGTCHVNEQWPSYWAARFQKYGFECADVIRPLVWNKGSIPVYYRQNAMFYVAADAKTMLPSGVGWGGADLVHPELYERTRTARISGRAAVRAVYEAMKHRAGRAIRRP